MNKIKVAPGTLTLWMICNILCNSKSFSLCPFCKCISKTRLVSFVNLYADWFFTVYASLSILLYQFHNIIVVSNFWGCQEIDKCSFLYRTHQNNKEDWNFSFALELCYRPQSTSIKYNAFALKSNVSFPGSRSTCL